MPDQKTILRIVVHAGEILLAGGAEIFRVQETMERIAKAYGANKLHVYVLTNGLFASVEDDGKTLNSELRNVPRAAMHMGKIVAINDLSRRIEMGAITPEQAANELDRINVLPFTNSYARVGACAMGAACFCYLYGGGVWDAFAAFFAGVVLQLFLLFLEKHSLNRIVQNILAAALASFVSFALLNFLGLGSNLDKIIIGAIIPLVPGMALTTSIRDFANGDYLSGTIRLIDAILVGSSIAIGVGGVLVCASLVTGVAI